MASFVRFCSLVVLLVFASIEAKRHKGSINTGSGWNYVSKFCYAEGTGNLTWTATTNNDSNTVLAFYDDAGDSWPAIYPRRNQLSCEDLVKLAHGVRPIYSGANVIQPFDAFVRPYYWFFVVANCKGPIVFNYDFHMTNPGGAWQTEFSYDDQGLVGMYLFYWLAFTIGTLVHLFGVYQLFRAGAYHHIVRFLTATIILQLFSVFFIFIHYAVYAKNGVGSPGLKGFGDVLDMGSQLVFMMLLILLAQGWTITRFEIPHKRILLALIAVFLALYFSMFIWVNVGQDPASTVYSYGTVPGILIVCLRVLTLIWFGWSLRGSYLEESHPGKRRFYLLFGGIFTLWWIQLPLIVIIAGQLAEWVRQKTVMGMYLTTNSLAIAILAFLLWPSRAQEYFQIAKTDLLLGRSPSSPYETL